MDYLAIAALLIMALGLAGIVIPGIPGVLVVFGGALFYSLLSGFREFNAGWLVFMGAIAAGATAFDLVAAPAVARRFGASKWGVIGAIVGLVAGFFVGGPLGAILGPFIGAAALELVFGRDIRRAFQSGLGTAVGYVASLLVDAAACITIILLFAALVIL
jgi:uncharacterized protein